MNATAPLRPSFPLALSALLMLGACAGGSGGASGGGEAPAPAGPPPAAVAPSGSAPASGAASHADVLAAVLGPDRAGEPSTLDGIYTDAQAERGRGVFLDVCAECHSTSDWTEDGFLERWNGESVWRFWHYIYEQMPNGEPPYTLERQEVTDAVAFILRLNGVPTGPAELGTEDEAIDVHWLVWPAGS